MENSSIENNKKKMPKSRKILIIIITILLIAVIGAIIYLLINGNMHNNLEDTENKNIQKDYDLNIYAYGNGNFCEEKSEYCNNLALTLKVETENTKVLSVLAYIAILYDDNGLKIYNALTKETKKINLENNYSNYKIFFDKDTNNVYGIAVNNDSDNYYDLKYYDVVNDKYLFDGKYKEINAVNENYIQADGSLINLKTGAVLKNGIDVLIYSVKVGDKYFFVGTGDGFYGSVLYNNKLNLIAENNSTRPYEKWFSFNDGYLYVINHDNVEKYNVDGDLIQSKAYKNAEELINNYIVCIKDNKILLENFDTEKSMILGDFDSKSYIEELETQYYSKEELENMGISNKQEGVYVTVMYNDGPRNGLYGIEYCYNPETEKVVTYNITEQVGGRAKPVLYLYPKKTTNVKVTFIHPEYLTTTYPKYNNGWDVIANPNGDLYDKDNKYYYGLYWDEVRYNEVDFHEGFYVTKENAIDFLEEKLTIIGLNPKERNEFIMYWLPILENNKQSLVYFELTNEREKDNKLIIEPKPDSLLRVSIHIKKVDSFVSIKEQKLSSFERVGFSAVEWGGMTY